MNFRAMEQHGENDVMNIVRDEQTSDNFIVKTAKKGIWFAARLRQLTAKVMSEVEESQKLLYEVSVSSAGKYFRAGHHLWDRREI